MNPRDAFHATVHDCPGGCEALAVRLGMSAAILRNKANVRHETNKPMLDDVDRVMAITGDHRVLHALAQNHGYVCVKMGEHTDASDVAVLELVTQVWTTNGEVGAEVNRTLADGKVDAAEVKRVRAAVYRAQRALEEVVARLDGMAEPAPRRRK
jgi:hypothetical protein